MESLGKTLGIADYAAILRRHVAMFLAIVAAFTIIAVWRVSNQADAFEAHASVLVRTATNQQLFPAIGSNFAVFTRTPNAELEFVSSDAFRAQVEAPASVSVSAPIDSNQLIFTGHADNPEDAVNAANIWAEAYVRVRHARDVAENEVALAAARATLTGLQAQREVIIAPLKPLDDALIIAQTPEQISQLTTQRLALQQSLADELLPIESDIRNLSTEISQLTSQARFLARPDVSAVVATTAQFARQTAPQPMRDIGLAVVLGLFTAAAAVLLYDNLRDRIVDAEDLRRVLEPVPVLATIPRARHDVATTSELRPAVVEGVENLLTAIGLVRRSTGLQVVLVTSPNEREGKTFTVHWLAERAARQGVRTLLIDGDLRRPRIHAALGMPMEPGLYNLAHSKGSTPPGEFVTTVTGPEGWQLDVLPAGRSDEHAVTVLRDGDIGLAVQKFHDHYDLILIDSPPLLPVTDALVWCELVADGVVLLARAGRTKRDELLRAARSLQPIDVTFIGTVLVGEHRKSSYYD